MTRERYWQWMTVWQWFQAQKNGPPELYGLYDLLNEMWQQDRQTSTREELAAYSQKFDIESDPEFKKFMRDLNSNRPKRPPEK